MFAMNYSQMSEMMPICNPISGGFQQQMSGQLADSYAALRKSRDEMIQQRIDAIPQMSNRQLLEEIYKMLLNRYKE